MSAPSIPTYLSHVLENMPTDWLSLTTHRLDIYDESVAKSGFLDAFEALYEAQITSSEKLKDLPTAYDYIRLGHPLSCLLEWYVSKTLNVNSSRVISFDSATAPLLAVLRTNGLKNRATRILVDTALPNVFDEATIREVYGYQFEIVHPTSNPTTSDFEGTTVAYLPLQTSPFTSLPPEADITIHQATGYGTVLSILSDTHADYVSDIQHFRRRETVAMTPENTLSVLNYLIADSTAVLGRQAINLDSKRKVIAEMQSITNAATDALVASSGLSMQYAIMMGLLHAANENHPGKPVQFIVPPNCYGGTNDQARRVAACFDHVTVVDLEVDGDADMVLSVRHTLAQAAAQDSVPYIIAEIPTNPRVEVPNLEALREALQAPRLTSYGAAATAPVFILDQTFCPNLHFLSDSDVFAGISTIAYMSGSKFPSGGKCTAGLCVANSTGAPLIDCIDKHLQLNDNEATPKQYDILAQQLPSMNQRIADAYRNTRAFVDHIEATLPQANINFVSQDLAKRGFTPSVFSLDLPTQGDTHEQREMYKRELNDRLIKMMIEALPNESKYCVSYGQLKGCYWTIPATSTQGTTKEADKDYIARVALSPSLDLQAHKEVFNAFVATLEL